MGIDLSGKAAIVTGGARGIGHGMATALLKAGAAVTVTDILEDTLKEAGERFDAIPGARHLELVADGRDEEAVKMAVQRTAEEFGRIDVLVNNAQTSIKGKPIQVQTVDEVMVGLDSGFRAALPDPLAPDAFEGLGQIYQLFRTIVACPVPTIAAVQGPAVGAGVNLALACDVRVVSEGAQLSGFGRAGLHPGGGHFELLCAVDRQVAAWLALCNQVLRGEDLLRTGVAVALVPSEALDAEARRIAGDAARDPALARMLTASFRTIDGGVARHAAAVQVERAPQLWSLRRLHDRTTEPGRPSGGI